MSTATNSDLTLMSATIIKNIRAVASIVVYDLLFKQNSMRLEDQFIFCYDSFHGAPEKNIVSQMDLLLSGHRFYNRLFTIELSSNVTDRNVAAIPSSQNSADGSLFYLKNRYCTAKARFLRGKHFTKESLSSPTKTRPQDKITGRNVYDLAQSTLRNLKKVTAMAEEWLDDGKLPSGRSWDDLYDHLISKSDEMSKEKGSYTGWIAFEILTKYNEHGENILSLLNNEDAKKREGEGRSDFRKKAKLKNDAARSVQVGADTNAFRNRGLSIQARLHVIEMAQVEDAKKIRKNEVDVANANTQLQLLLEERKQAILLAKSICANFDKDDEFWKDVLNITEQVKKKKVEIESLMACKKMCDSEIDKSTKMAESLLANLTEDASTINIQDNAPQDNVPQDSVPQDNVPQDNALQDNVPQDNVPMIPPQNNMPTVEMVAGVASAGVEGTEVSRKRRKCVPKLDHNDPMSLYYQMKVEQVEEDRRREKEERRRERRETKKEEKRWTMMMMALCGMGKKINKMIPDSGNESNSEEDV
uniref:Uncharacterized protein n=1 Tax=Corethron hystrix TaxID=216773 RepID=A0A6U5L0F0_9STRA|mmetsp:Transcript_42244/g.99098  ORF Transcript_42244/g.99098 Transcript_42244/m.99098 type:complete len:530 (+) Transcript_42244:587-2176(+)